MCKLKSGIILKDSVFVPNYDSHTDMLEELKIKDTRKNAERLFVRAEFYPKENIFSDVNKWIYHVDQDILPEWYVEEVDKDRFIKAVKEWHKKHVLVGVDGITLSGGDTYYIKDCKNVVVKNDSTVEAYGNSTVKACNNSTVEAYDNSTVEAYDNSTVKAYDNSTVEAYGNSTVKAYGNSTVKAFNNSTVKACNNSTVKAYDNSTVEAYDNSTVVISLFSNNRKDNIKLSDNATLKDCKTKTIYQSGNWKFEKV